MITLTKISETPTTITLGWTPVPGCIGYVYYADDTRVANTWDPAVNQVKFSKGAAKYKVVAVNAGETGVYPPAPVGVPQNFKAADPTATSVMVSWDAVAGATSYKLAMIPPDGTTQYATTTALSKTYSGLAPDTTYEFDIQTVAAAGESAWHGRIAVTTDPGAPTPATGVHYAVGCSADETKSANIAQSVGAKLQRSHDKTPGTAASTIQSACQTFQSRGIRPYILCNWGNNDNVETITPGQIPEWVKAVGPGGTWYQTHPEWAALAVTHIEMGNEWFYNYRGGINQARCGNYARGFRDTVVAARQANPAVKFLFMTDIDNQGTTPFNNMVDWFYLAVPNIHEYIDGYTFHTYGPPTASGVFPKMTTILTRMESHGAPKDIPIWITEDGIASDNGRNLVPNNYGWPTNMTYAQAGQALRDKFKALRDHAVVGPRLECWTNYQAHDQQPSGATSEREHYFGIVQQNGTSAKGDITQSAKDHARVYP